MEDEEIICIALLKIKTFNNLNPNDLKTLAQLFNISNNNSFELTLLQLKKTIAYLVLIQRSDMEQYLSLSKFKRLPAYLYQQTVVFFKGLWQCFLAEKIAIQQTHLQKIQQTKTPMEKIGHLLQDSRISEHGRTENAQINYNRFNYFNRFAENANETRLNYPPVQPLPPPYLFPYQNFVGNNMFHDYGNRSTLMNNMMIDSRQRIPQVPAKQGRTPQVPAKQVKSMQSIQRNDQKFKQQYLSQRQIESEQIKAPDRQCFCGQVIQGQLIKCSLCNKQYHAKCFQSSKSEAIVCPFCKLTYKNFYTKVYNQPILQRCELASEHVSDVKKLLLVSRQLELLSEAIVLMQTSEKYWMEVRIIRTPSKKEGEPKGFKSCFYLPLTEVKKMYNRKWFELKLKNINEEGFIFIILGCVFARDVAQVQKDIQNSSNSFVQIAFLRRILRNLGRTSVTMSVYHPVTKNRITFPVRGIRCQHILCQDLNFIYEQGIKKQGKIICSFCNKQYSVYQAFQVDMLIYKKLNENPQASEVQISLRELDEQIQSNMIARRQNEGKASSQKMIQQVPHDGSYNSSGLSISIGYENNEK